MMKIKLISLLRFVSLILLLLVGTFLLRPSYRMLESSQDVPSRLLSQPHAPSSDVIKVACILDSLSDTGYTRGGSVAYPPLLQSYLDNLHPGRFEVKHFAKAANSICESAKYPYKTDARNSVNNTILYEQAINYAPEYIIIMGGTNDSTDSSWVDRGCESTFQNDAEELYRSFVDLGSTRVLAAVPPAVASPNRYHASKNVIENKIIPMIQQAAENVGAIIIPTYNFTLNHISQWMVDGVHFNERGAKEIASFFGDYILDQCVNDGRCSTVE